MDETLGTVEALMQADSVLGEDIPIDPTSFFQFDLFGWDMLEGFASADPHLFGQGGTQQS